MTITIRKHAALKHRAGGIRTSSFGLHQQSSCCQGTQAASHVSATQVKWIFSGWQIHGGNDKGTSISPESPLEKEPLKPTIKYLRLVVVIPLHN
jgi:hypothetical protein